MCRRDRQANEGGDDDGEHRRKFYAETCVKIDLRNVRSDGADHARSQCILTDVRGYHRGIVRRFSFLLIQSERNRIQKHARPRG